MGALLKGFLSALIPLLSSTLLTITGRIFTALGLGFISYAGLNVIQDYFLQFLQSRVSEWPADAWNLALILGLGTCLNWAFGTLAFIVSLKSMSKLSAVLTAKG